MPEKSLGGSRGKVYGEVGPADALRALSLLGREELAAGIAWINEMLQMEVATRGMPEEASESKGQAEWGVRRGEETMGPALADLDEEPAPKSPPDAAEAPDEGPVLPYRVVAERREEERGQPFWLAAAELLPQADPQRVKNRPELIPLLNPQWARAVLSAAFSTAQEDGPVDMDRIIHEAVRCRPITQLPRRTLPTLRMGIQLLLDRGPGMMPFARDMEHLFRLILDVVGRDRVEVLHFAACPLRGNGPRSRLQWRRRYDPPAAGTPVVLLTDLGIARRRDLTAGAGEGEWLRFVSIVRAAGCPLLALVPYADTGDRWPRRLRRFMHILPWDRSTTASQVRRTIGKGLRVIS